MRKLPLILLLLISTGVLFAFLGGDGDPQQKKKRRIMEEKILDIFDQSLLRESQSSYIFLLTPEDSLKIKCRRCGQLMAEGLLSIKLKSGEGEVRVRRKDLGNWIPIGSPTGKFGLVLQRNTDGDPSVSIRNLQVFRKVDSTDKYKPATLYTLADLKGAHLDQLVTEVGQPKQKFVFRLKRNDQVKVSMITTTTGEVDPNLLCTWYRAGEEFAKEPAPNNQFFTITGEAEYSSKYVFEFSKKGNVKEIDNLYNIRFDRIPSPETFATRKEEVVDTQKVDTVAAEKEEMTQEEMLLELIKAMNAGKQPEFVCKTVESFSAANISPKLNLNPGRKYKQCFDILLSDECAAPEECEKCESFWVFWIGAGDDVVEAYRFRDSTRKQFIGEGLLEAFAISQKFRKVSGGGIFPESNGGEDIYYAILDDRNRQRFLLDADYTQARPDSSFSGIKGGFVTTDFRLLPYTPGMKVSLCVTNNNDITTVPFAFHYQQFMLEPDTLLFPDAGSDEEVPGI